MVKITDEDGSEVALHLTADSKVDPAHIADLLEEVSAPQTVLAYHLGVSLSALQIWRKQGAPLGKFLHMRKIIRSLKKEEGCAY